MLEIDLLTLLAPAESVPAPVEAALARQGNLKLRRHLVEGCPLPGETRVETIARARNEARGRGSQPLVMFLDRDVLLPDGGIERLALALAFRRSYAALGINYQSPVELPAVHVAMGATLFHRSVLERLTFRTEPGMCECLCCCLDVRAMGYCIDYLPGLTAEHWKPASPV
jgi:hypothetical protein